MWLPEEGERKRLYLISGVGGALVLLMLGVWWFVSPSSGSSTPIAAASALNSDVEKQARKKDTEGLRQSGRSGDAIVASQAVYALSTEATPANISALQGFFTDPRPEVRAQAVAGYARIAPRTSYPQVERIAIEDKDVQVKLAAVNALGNMYAWRSLSSLLTLMDDPNERVREAAAIAFQRISFVRIDQSSGPTDYGYRANDPPETRRRAIQQLRTKFIGNRALEAQYNEWLSKQPAGK